MNWDDTRIFLALTRAPSLRAAARSLGVDQATAGRRLNALQAELGAKLFLRAKDGYLLTAAGETALAAARRMESAALDLRTRIEGQDTSPGGLVRVTSTDSIAIDLLMPAIERLQQHWPHIRVGLEVSTQLLSLSRRQVDIAFRNVRPEAPDLVVRRVASWPVGLFASAGYVERFGVPVPEDELRGHHLVAYARPTWSTTRFSPWRACLRARPRSRWRCAPVCWCARAWRRALGWARCRCGWASAKAWCVSGPSAAGRTTTRSGR